MSVSRMVSIVFSAVFLLVHLMAYSAPWGNNPSHNHVLEAKNLPVEFNDETAIWQIDTTSKHQFPMPTIVGDKCLVGSDGGGNPDPFSSRGGALTCYSMKDGSELWRLMVMRNGNYGVCGVPVVEGDRVYILANHDVFCLDLDGLADGNDGIQTELEFLRKDLEANKIDPSVLTELPDYAADVIWHFSLRPWDIEVQDATSCSVIEVDGQIWVSTANELGDRSRRYRENDDDPHMVVLNKETGALIARDEMSVPIVFHGEWSSPSLIEVDGEKAVLFPDGYGVLHAFKIPERSEDGSPVILEEYWTYDMNPPENRFLDDGREIIYTLDKRLLHKYPPGYYSDPKTFYMFNDDAAPEKSDHFQGYDSGVKNASNGQHETVTGPCEIISMPAVVGNRIYLGIGRDRAYGLAMAKGRFMCLEVKDVKLPPEILWEDRNVGRTQCTASIVDGLCYVADGFGNLNCWDADTGEVMYRYDLDAKRGIRERSQMVADGKIYICNERKQMKVIKAGREPVLLGESRLKSDAATIDAVDGLVLIVTHRSIGLYGDKSYVEKLTSTVE